jgi:hypothetical protein
MSDRNREESKHVPDPKIRPAGNVGPAILDATAVKMSHGLATIQMAALGEKERTLGMIDCMMPTFRSTRFKRDSPGFCAAPAVTMTRCESLDIDLVYGRRQNGTSRVSKIFYSFSKSDIHIYLHVRIHLMPIFECVGERRYLVPNLWPLPPIALDWCRSRQSFRPTLDSKGHTLWPCRLDHIPQWSPFCDPDDLDEKDRNSRERSFLPIDCCRGWALESG